MSRLNQKYLVIKPKKLRISKKLCCCLALCNIGCCKKSMKNQSMNQTKNKQHNSVVVWPQVHALVSQGRDLRGSESELLEGHLGHNLDRLCFD